MMIRLSQQQVLGPGLSRLLRIYHLGPDHPFKIRLWTLVRRATGYPRLTLPYADSGWITVDERDLVQREVYVTGSYEPEVWGTLASYATSGDVVWDIGAHIGTMSIRALLDSRVSECHAFEPDPIQADVLAFNLALNCGGIVHRYALSDHPESRRLYHGPQSNIGLSSLESHTAETVFTVACYTGDHLVFEEGISAPTLIKIDVEGWEFPVLRGMQRLLTERPPRAIVFESTVYPSGELANCTIGEYLANYHYEVQRIQRSGQHIDEKENFLAVHRSVAL